MAQRVRIPHRGRKSFVCHTTPHSDSTSRGVPTLFANTIHHVGAKVNNKFGKGRNLSCRESQIVVCRRRVAADNSLQTRMRNPHPVGPSTGSAVQIVV